MADIRFDGVRKVYGDNVLALDEFSLHIPSPTLVVLVGPSGCGKTTLLRLIAGLETPTSGTITLGDERLDTVDARKRDVAMVFQNYALYPHMTVRENLSFGLKIRKVPKATIVQKVDAVSEDLEIAGLLDRKPAELSGGQRQRVALGRAVIREPKVFLFDEPLSNLDARLRDEMRYLIKKLYQRLGTTTVYVTHDQVEAMTIGEVLVILKDGRIHQVGSPSECYRRPNNEFVASFLGSPPMNLMGGVYEANERVVVLRSRNRLGLPPEISSVLDHGGSRDLIIGVRPEDLVPRGSLGGSPGIAFEGRVVLTETLGHDVLTHVDLGEDEIVVRGGGLSDGRVALEAPASALHFFEGKDGSRVDILSGAAGPVHHGIEGSGTGRPRDE
jgi:multiple sugar transport system ATP-binding protein